MARAASFPYDADNNAPYVSLRYDQNPLSYCSPRGRGQFHSIIFPKPEKWLFDVAQAFVVLVGEKISKAFALRLPLFIQSLNKLLSLSFHGRNFNFAIFLQNSEPPTPDITTTRRPNKFNFTMFPIAVLYSVVFTICPTGGNSPRSRQLLSVRPRAWSMVITSHCPLSLSR